MAFFGHTHLLFETSKKRERNKTLHTTISANISMATPCCCCCCLVEFRRLFYSEPLPLVYAHGYSEYGLKVQGGFLPGHLSRDTGVRPFLLLIN